MGATFITGLVKLPINVGGEVNKFFGESRYLWSTCLSGVQRSELWITGNE